jgi:putative transposase
MCSALSVTPGAYYSWISKGGPERANRDRELRKEIWRIHEQYRGVYGAKRVSKELEARGMKCSPFRVARLRREAGIESPSNRRRDYLKRQQEKAVAAAPNLLKGHFRVTAPNRVWVGDMTFVRTRAGFLHLAVLLDLYSCRVVGWGMSDRPPNIELAMSALGMALLQRQPREGLIHHTDRGIPYRSNAYLKCLNNNRIRRSMSAIGSPWQNEPAEQFFRSFKQELVYNSDFSTREEAQAAIFEYIEIFYNRQRRHKALDYLSPMEFEERKGVSMVSL